MKAVVTVEPGRMELRELPEPRPDASEALVRVEAVGICGSDFDLYRGTDPYASFPLLQGHEFCGSIVELGSGYGGPLEVGERVAVEPLIACGECYPCRRGRRNCCVRLQVLGAHVPGALCELIAVPADAAFALGGLDRELGALVEPVSIGLQAVTRAAVAEGEWVVVLGAGPIGQAVLLAARDRGARVLAVDVLEERLALATSLGASSAIDAAREDVSERVAAWTGGDGPDVVVEATGLPDVMATAIDIVASSGRVVILGTSIEDFSASALLLTSKELTILGSRNNMGLFGEAVELVRDNQEAVRRLVTHHFDLDETPGALEFGLANRDKVEKIVINVEEGTREKD